MKAGGRFSRPLLSLFKRPLIRSIFFIPAFFLLLLLVVFPVLQTVYLSFVFHPPASVTFGENTMDAREAMTEDAGVRAADPNRNFDLGVPPGARFDIRTDAFLWLRFNLSGIPNGSRVVAASLRLYSDAHDASGSAKRLVVAGAADTVPGTSWVEGLAKWNTYDGVAPWTAGADGGARDRGDDFRSLQIVPTDPDGYIALAFNPDGVDYVNERVDAFVNLQVYATEYGHQRLFVLSEGVDGKRPFLEVTYELPEMVVGTLNYGEVLTDQETLNPSGIAAGQSPFGTLFNNLIWIVIHLPFSLLLGLFLAITLQKVKGSSIVKSMIFIGMVTPLIVGGVILRFLFESPVGIVPSFFATIGIDALGRSWLTSSPGTLLFGLIFGSVWLWTGFSLIVYSAGLTTIPTDYFEAAKIDGASDWRMFRKITWPLLRPITLVVVTMTLLWELKLFDIVIAATNPQGGLGGAADVLALQMYRYGFVESPPDFGAAAVVATILTLLTLVAATWLFKRMLLGKRRKGGFLGRLWGFLRSIPTGVRR